MDSEPMKKWYVRQNAHHILVLILGIVCLGVFYGIEKIHLIHSVNDKHTWLMDDVLLSLIKDIGIALVVSYILLTTIERITKENQEKENKLLLDTLGKKLLEVVYKRNVPEKIFDEVMSSLLSSDVIRKKHRFSITLKKCADPHVASTDEYVNFCATDSAIIENINMAADEITYTTSMALDITTDAHLSVLCRIDGMSIDGIEIPRDVIDASSTMAKGFLKFSYPIKLKRGESKEIVFKWNTLKRIEDSEVMSLQLPSDGVELTVITPDGDFDIKASTMHGREFEPENTNNNYAKTWNLNYGIFPHQGIYFAWYPLTTSLQGNDNAVI